MTTYIKLKNEYSNLLETMEVLPNWKDAIDRKARGIYANKARYEEVSLATNVPWQVIGLIHSLEANLDFTKNLYNGEPLNQRTRKVPKGKGPFSSWEEAAVEALQYDGLDKIEDWSDEQVAYALEKYNGFGYRTRRTGVLSPYLWSGTNHYTTGKFVEEKDRSGKYVSVYKPNVKSAQIGAVPLYLRLKEIDIPKKEIVAKSSKLTLISRARKWFAGLSLSGIAADTMGWLEGIKDYIIANPSTMIYALAGLSTVGFIIFKVLEDKGVKEYEEGRYVPSGQDNA